MIGRKARPVRVVFLVDRLIFRHACLLARPAVIFYVMGLGLQESFRTVIILIKRAPSTVNRIFLDPLAAARQNLCTGMKHVLSGMI
jgi:hypothetical protein